MHKTLDTVLRAVGEKERVVVVGSGSAEFMAGERERESVRESGERTPYLLAITSDVTKQDKAYVTNRNV